MHRLQAIIEWKEGRFDEQLTETAIENALNETFEFSFVCHSMQAFEGKRLKKVVCPAGDCIKSQAICRSFDQDDMTGWCVHWDQDTGICDDPDITKLLGE